MKKHLLIGLSLFVLIAMCMITPSHAEARARYGSIRVGGYTSHGKGSHYIGGYVRTTHTLKYYQSHY